MIISNKEQLTSKTPFTIDFSASPWGQGKLKTAKCLWNVNQSHQV